MVRLRGLEDPSPRSWPVITTASPWTPSTWPSVRLGRRGWPWTRRERPSTLGRRLGPCYACQGTRRDAHSSLRSPRSGGAARIDNLIATGLGDGRRGRGHAWAPPASVPQWVTAGRVSPPAERRSAGTCLSSAWSGVVVRGGAGPGGSGPAGRGETETDGERRAGGGDKGARGHADRRRAHLGSPACSCTAVLCSWWPPAGDVWRRARGRGAATSGGGRGRLRGDPPLRAATTRPARAPASQSAPAAPTRDPERPVGAGTEASRCGPPRPLVLLAGAAGLFPSPQRTPSPSCHLAQAWTL